MDTFYLSFHIVFFGHKNAFDSSGHRLELF